jgi:mRNA export factor
MSFFGAKPAVKPAVNEAIANDVEVPNAPSDSISAMAFSPTADYLAVASWDNQVRVYEVGQAVTGKAAYSHEAPALDVCWSKDGTKVLSGGADNAARMYDVQTGQSSQVAQHQAPIRCTRWIDLQSGLLATGSWDKTIKVGPPA